MTDISTLGNKEIFAKNLTRILKMNNITSAKVCNDLHISPSTFSDWINAKKYPRIDKLEKLANYFNIQKSDLIEDFDKEENKLNELNIIYQKISSQDVLNDYEKNVIKSVIDNAVNRYENQNELNNET